MSKKIVVALGGNALGNTPSEQIKSVRIAAKAIYDLSQKGYSIVVCHGNGPQVGIINQGMQQYDFAFAECNAMSQGYIGFHLCLALNEIIKDKNIVSIVTQVIVDKDDIAFNNPTKPIGNFYTKDEAIQLEKQTGRKYAKDSNRGYRQVIASPSPKEIIEINTIRNLLDNNTIVIAGGGGGIPVIMQNDCIMGIDAVIDKDMTSSKIADSIDADMLLILTAVKNVCINYGKINEQKLQRLDINLANEYIKQNQFASGSMLPKVIACMKFVKDKPNRKAIITSLDNCMSFESGTIIEEKLHPNK